MTTDRTGKLLIVAYAVVALVMSLAFPRHLPPYLDFDTSTMVIFVNNVSERGDPDYFFADSFNYEDHYRANWAQQFLPVAAPCAALKTVLRLGARHTATLLTVLAMGFAGLACLLAAGFAWTVGERDRQVLAFTFACSWIVPSYYLLGRSGVVSFMLYGALFWGALWLFALYCRTGRSRYLYAISLVLGYHLLCGYPTMYALPLFFLATLLCAERPMALVKSWHVLGSVLLIPVAAAAIIGVICLCLHVDLRDYWHGTMAFYANRSVASVDSANTLLARLQHFVGKQALLDPTILVSRDEDLWLYGRIVWSWLAVLGLAVWGGIRAWRSGDQSLRLFAAALGGSLVLYIVFLSPEIRYMFALTPCYVYLAARGLDGLGARRRWVLLAILVALAGESAYVGRTVYSPRMQQTWAHYAGQREAIDLVLQQIDNPQQTVLFGLAEYHPQVYHDFLYITAYSDFRLLVPSHQPMLAPLLDGRLKADKVFVLANAESRGEIATLAQRGYTKYADIHDPPSGRVLELWGLDNTRK